MSIIGFMNFLVMVAALVVALVMMVLLDSEYNEVKDLCPDGERCIPIGQYSMHSYWGVDGVLRLQAIIGLFFAIVAACITTFVLPETLPPQHRSYGSTWEFIRNKWKAFAKPWESCQVFATPQLRCLIGTSILHQVTKIAFVSAGLALIERHDVQAKELGALYVAAAIGSLPTFCIAQCLVPRCGDLWAVWVPGGILSCIAVSFSIFSPKGFWAVIVAVAVSISGPAGVLLIQKDGLISKLTPPDTQATWRGAKNFMFHILNAVFIFPLAGLLHVCKKWSYPFDMAPAMVSFAACLASALLSLYMAVNMNPKKTIDDGQALEEFYASPYAKSHYGKSVAAFQQSSPVCSVEPEQLPPSGPGCSVLEDVSAAGDIDHPPITNGVAAGELVTPTQPASLPMVEI